MAEPSRSPSSQQTLSSYYMMKLNSIPDKVLAETLDKWIKAVTPAHDYTSPSPEWWPEDVGYDSPAELSKATLLSSYGV
ncbi:hypothetical protein N7466_009409 [Penicillium verhagenii]|uniref:uncharacterized protein n=1 Tax=Penicillium verhagenii TaxID=1562060 RepID=UPI0025459D4C|nr:uncharacterized protein N7466_009409 [Penicillium verhagenii]KAJ5921083.1 hypothetical protein N7466_009409 [Penicillium verhagenii]